jgi:hypothetical protein
MGRWHQSAVLHLQVPFEVAELLAQNLSCRLLLERRSVGRKLTARIEPSRSQSPQPVDRPTQGVGDPPERRGQYRVYLIFKLSNALV